jgi:predicted HTH transcriptional regulator
MATIKRHIQELKKTGKIERIGNDKTGNSFPSSAKSYLIEGYFFDSSFN